MRPVSSRVFCLAAALALSAAFAEGVTLNQTGILQGRVIDRASLATSAAGKGIAGARLILYNADGKQVAGKTASKSGAYAFPRLAAGNYTLSIARKDYAPSPLLRSISLASGDTLFRHFTLDRIPFRSGIPVRRYAPNAAKASAGSGKDAGIGYYPDLAEGMLAAMRSREFHREGAATANKGATLSRFFDEEDTTVAYRDLWANLLWAEVESQTRPIEAVVYLAQAFDSTLKAADLPSPPDLKPYLKVSADSLEALAAAVRAMLLAPAKKTGARTLAGKVPRSMLVRIIEAQIGSKAVPKAKKKNFLAKAKTLIGADAFRKLALLADPPRKKPAATRKNAIAPGPLQPDTEWIWKVVREMAATHRPAGSSPPNPVALYHLAMRRLEQGHAREALADLQRAAALRAEYPRALEAQARCRLALADTAGAESLFDSLSRTESPEWQARGFRGAAKIQWLSARPEKAEAGLWRALGLDSKSPAARDALLLLAEISLTRDSWSSVEGLLDSLVRASPREADGRFWLGRMALKRGQDGVALGHFQAAFALAPRRPEFAVAVASVHLAREECAAALKTLKPLRAGLSGEGLSVYGQCLLQTGRAGEAVREFERLHAGNPTAPHLAIWARALSAAGQPRRAMAVIQASGHSGDFEVRKALAAAALDLGSAEQARQLLESAAAGRESDAELHFLLGRADYALRDFPGASRQLTFALQYREDYPEAKYLQGLCLLKQGRSGEARHYFLELVDSDKASWHAKGLLGQGQAFAKEEKLEAAAENLRLSFLAAPTAEAAAHLALACLRMERMEEASGWAAKARKLDPDEPLGLMASVDALLAAHKTDEAVDLARTGLDRHPGACDFLVVAAKAHLRAGHDQQARDLSQQARGRCPEESAPYFYLGTLSARAGTVAEARRHFGEYLRVGGDARRVPEGYR